MEQYWAHHIEQLLQRCKGTELRDLLKKYGYQGSNHKSKLMSVYKNVADYESLKPMVEHLYVSLNLPYDSSADRLCEKLYNDDDLSMFFKDWLKNNEFYYHESFSFRRLSQQFVLSFVIHSNYNPPALFTGYEFLLQKIGEPHNSWEARLMKTDIESWRLLASQLFDLNRSNSV